MEYGRALYFRPAVSSFFSSPILSRRRLDAYDTSSHGVALVRICDAGLTRAARGSQKYRAQKIAKNSPFSHHRTILSGYILTTNVHIDNRIKVLNSNISSTCPHNMVNFGPLAAEIGLGVSNTPVNFNGFRVLASLLQRRRSTKANQTLHDGWLSPGLVFGRLLCWYSTLCLKKVPTF